MAADANVFHVTASGFTVEGVHAVGKGTSIGSDFTVGNFLFVQSADGSSCRNHVSEGFSTRLSRRETLGQRRFGHRLLQPGA